MDIQTMCKNEKKRPLILVTNDDGVRAQGIEELTLLMRELGDVVVVAPDSPRSGASCSITPTVPVGFKLLSTEEGLSVYHCTGSPVDCVKLAVSEVMSREPDLIVSGVNHGDNASVSIHYSGTVGAVIEGCVRGIPSIAFSIRTLSHQLDFSPYRQTIRDVAQRVLQSGLPQDVCLNVNFPEVAQLRGLRVCRLAHGVWSSEWKHAGHPHGASYYWLTGRFENLEPQEPDTDYAALDLGYATLTPIRLDMTAHDLLSQFKDLER